MGNTAMSGACVPHLQRRNGIVYLRMRVPKDVRPMVGLLEIKKSFGSCGNRRARSMVGIYAVRIMEAFEVIRANELSIEQARQCVRDCFFDLIRETESYPRFYPQSHQRHLEVSEQREASADRIAELKQQTLSGEFDRSVIAVAKAYLPAEAEMASPVVSLIVQGVARAMIEQQRLSVQRLDDGLAPFHSIDPLFAAPPPTKPDDMMVAKPSVPIVGLSLGEAIASYLKAGEKKLRPKTIAARRWQMEYLEASLGTDTPLSTVTSHDIRKYRDEVLSLRKNHGPSEKVAFLKKLTDSPAHRIAPKTAALIFEPCKSMFRWAHEREGLIDSNPAACVHLDAPKTNGGEKLRRPFTADELTQLFGSPLFVGHKSRDRRYEHGLKVTKDAKWWIPVLGFYTGARLGELVQLHTRDIHLDGPIPYISINDDNSGLPADAPRKHLKSAAASRNVPIHPDVMELGFADFVKSRTKSPKAPIRLFPEFEYGSDGQASTVASKWFGRLMAKVGLTDPALVFHSFRHSAEDAFRNAGQQQYVIDRIIGHANSATSAGYGQGISLEVANEAIKNMAMEVRLPAIIAKVPSLDMTKV